MHVYTYVENNLSKLSGSCLAMGSQDDFSVGGFGFYVKRFDSFNMEALLTAYSFMKNILKHIYNVKEIVINKKQTGKQNNYWILKDKFSYNYHYQGKETATKVYHFRRENLL